MRKITWFMIVAVTVVIMASNSIAFASTPAQVDVNVLNLRSGPGTGFQVIQTLQRGTPLIIMAEHQEWKHVQTASGLNGWVHGQYIVVDSVFKKTTGQIQVNVPRLNVRQGPETSYAVIATALEGQLLIVSGETPLWYLVTVSGQSGFVHKDFVSIVNETNPPQEPIGLPLARVAVNVLNMRSGSGTQYPVVTKLNLNTVIAIVDEGPWARIMLDNGVLGFVASEYITQIEGQAQVRINATAVNQRSGPGTGFAVMTTHPLGQTLACKGLDGGWVKVDSPAGEGYILGTLLSFSFSGTNGSLPPDFAGHNLNGFRVVLDAGHGGKDPGAIGVNGLYEKTVNLTLTQKLAHMLRQAGAEVIMTRNTDIYLTLDERVAIANSSGADLVVSIHNNAHPNSAVGGTQTFYGATPGSFDLGNGVHRNLVSIGLVDRRLLTANFKILRLTTIPAILTETAFLSNWGDATLLAQDAFLDQAALAHFLGIRDWLLRSR